METPFASPRIPQTTDGGFWPEPLRDEPFSDPFPWRVLLRWLLPGLIGGVLLAALLGILEAQAGRQIVFLTAQGRLARVRADGAGVDDVGARAWLLDSTGQDRLRRRLPILAAPQWSPDGRYLAATLFEKGSIQVALFPSSLMTPTLISSAATDVLAVPMGGWSPRGDYLALLEHDGAKPLLSLVNVKQARVTALPLVVDTREPLQWHPDGQRLLLTSLTEQVTPTLVIATTDGKTSVYAPKDDMMMRSDGAWSPDGKWVAYVAPDPKRGATAKPLAGSIVIAQAQGDRVAGNIGYGLNLAPVWAPKGDYIFFTRYLTATESYDLYRVNPDGGTLMPVGPGTPTMASLPQERRLYLDWSPDRRRMFFVGTDRQRRPTVYLAAYDGTGAEPIPTSCPTAEALAVQWAPTSRALLIACAGAPMRLHWVDAERPDTVYPVGHLPAWEP